MTILEALVGGALLLGTGYLKAKESLPCKEDDYKNMDNSEKARALSAGLKTSLQKDMKNEMDNFESLIKNKDDKYIVNAIKSLEQQGKENDYRYGILREEAYKRGLS